MLIRKKTDKPKNLTQLAWEMAEPHSHDAQPKVSEDTSAAQVHQSRLLHLVPKSTPIWSQVAQIHPVTPLQKIFFQFANPTSSDTWFPATFFFPCALFMLACPWWKRESKNMNGSYRDIRAGLGWIPWLVATNGCSYPLWPITMTRNAIDW